MFLMENKIDSEIKDVMSAVFKIPVDDITNDTSPDSVQLWDSLKHMQLVAGLEEVFEIEFTDKEIIEMTTFVQIKSALLKYLI